MTPPRGGRAGDSESGPSTVDQDPVIEDLPAVSPELRALLDASPDPVLVVDGAGRIAAHNQRLELLFALPEDRLLGRPVELLLPERHRRAHVAARGAYRHSPSMRAMSSRTGLMGRRGDGGEFPVEVSLTPILGSPHGLVLAVVRDVTSRLAVAETASVSTAALDAIADSIFTTDLSGNVEFLNQAAETLTGSSRAAARGRALVDILPLGGEDESRSAQSPVAGCLRRGGAEAREVVIASPGQERLTLDLSATPIRDATGAVTGAVVVARDVTHARRIARELAHEATHDPLTGLVNRREFERRLTNLLTDASGHRTDHALCFLDLDGFKRVNDGGGHGAGDELLRQLSELMRRRMRTRDTLARLGGDEFGLLLEHCRVHEAKQIAHGIRQAVHYHRFTAGGRTYRVGASIGVVPLLAGMRPEDVLHAADAACYAAKHGGGDQVQVSSGPTLTSDAVSGAPSEAKSHADS